MKVLLSLLITGSLIIAAPVSFAETYSETEMKERVGEMDDNADKKITFQEFYEEVVTDNTDSYDTNRDGYITSDEVEQEMTEDLIETVDEMNRLGVSESDANKTVIKTLNSIEQKSEAIVDQMDTDNDNLVEKEELKAYQRKQFNALDKNKDGFLSSADLRKKSSHKGYPIRWR